MSKGILGHNMDRIPDISFRVMSWIFAIRDKLSSPWSILDEFDAFLRELNRLCKAEGLLYIGNGHQSRKEAKLKIESSHMWCIIEENKRFMKCSPIKS